MTRTGPEPVGGVGAALGVGVVVGEVGPDLDEDRSRQRGDEGAPSADRSPTPLAPRPRCPTSTGAIAAGSVRGRAAISQMHVMRAQGRFGNLEKSGSRPSL